MKNPDWVRDEVILALDLYLRAGRKQLPPAHPEVVSLSELLNRLPIHDPESRAATFRNPNGISMILGNFLGIDPDRHTPGLSRNNRLQEEVWDDFANDPEALHRTAQAIAQASEQGALADPGLIGWDLEEWFLEGEVLTRLHLTRERNPDAVRRKKEQVVADTGRLACEACGFDFPAAYGPLGEGFIECHHTRPLAELPGERATRLADLAVVCANCHRMLHRGKRRATVQSLRALLQKGTSNRP
jgi:5-methylcytosine-specific restriction protein A